MFKMVSYLSSGVIENSKNPASFKTQITEGLSCLTPVD